MGYYEECRVLIFGHEANSWQSVTQLLRQNNFDIALTENIEELRKKLSKDRQAHQILLLHLPDNSFQDWLEKGKQLLNQFNLPILFLLDEITNKRFEVINRCNPYGFLLKDSDPHIVLQTINFAISAHQNRDYKQHTEELNTLATTFSSTTGRELFDKVCQHLVQSLGVDFAYIGEIIDNRQRVKVYSIYGEDKFLDPFEYDLENTPCADVVGQKPCIYTSGVQEVFPQDQFLQEMNIEGYIGMPLFSASGSPLGIAVLLDKSPLKEVKRHQQYLQIYSDRVAAEMERLHAEVELREREEELRSINAHISEGIYRSTPKDGLIYVNHAFATMFGYDDPEDLLSLEAVQLYASEGRRRELTDIENRNGFIKNEEVKFRRKDGSTFWGLMSGQVVRDEDGNIKYYDGSVLDITERKHALDENKRLLKVVQQSPEAILITNAGGQIVYVNPQFLTENESQKDELLDTMAPILIKNDNTATFYDELWETIQKGKIWTKTIQKHTKDDSKRWKKVTISPVFNSEEEVTNYVIIHKDITERKVRENELQKSLSEKEILLAEIHHRVKNNLAIVSGLLELAAQNRDANSAVRKTFHESQLRIQSMAMVHEKLYEAGNFTDLKIENYIAELVTFIKSTFVGNKEEVNVEIQNQADIQLNINQAIPCALMINELVTNAFKYAFGEGGGKLIIKLQSKEGKVLLIVQDDGPGLPEDFEQQPQNSLGFVLINQLTKQLQGNLTIKNENGARFEILFEKSDKSGSSSAGYIIDRRER